jgi:tripartite-type tricarboxylate transporter receptor subunit TctC
VVVDNRPGGAGGVGLTAYNKEPANGYNLYYSDSSVVVSYPILYNNSEIVKNILPLATVTQNHMMLFTSVNVNNFQDFKNKLSSKSTFGSWGVGSAGQMAGLELNDYLDVAAVHVPYKEYTQWFSDVSNQNILYGYATVASSIKMVQANRIKYIAYLGASRHPSFPDVPTLTELTHHKFKYTAAWISFFINKDVPANISVALEKDLKEVINSAEIRSVLNSMNYSPWNIDNSEFAKAINSETQVYQEITKKHNIVIE